MRIFGLTVLVLVLAGAQARAQKQTPSTEKPLDVLESEIDRLGTPAHIQSAGEDPDVKKRIADLEEKLQRMEEHLAQKSDAIEQLEDENEKLRQALRLRFGGGGAGSGLPRVPIPNRELIESVLREPAPFAERRESVAAAEEYTVVSEWGRSPDVAASLPGQVSSLIGMALAVPDGMGEAALAQLGQDLRRNYAAYDNINIEVFDDVAAARRFANEGKIDPKHRVMSISKFKHSGRDSLVVYRDGRAVTVP